MSVIVEAIKFNHDPNSAEYDAINIRKNWSQFIDVPEWIQSLCTRAEDSLAAYSTKETKGNTITIQAKFRRTDPSIQSIEVYARDPSNPMAQGCLYEILRRLKIIPIIPPPYGNCLGEVKARTITFPASGETDFEIFELEHIWPLTDFGLGIHTVKWQWQFRINPTDPWTDLATTHHKIYVVLEVPKLPWKQTPYDADNDQLPWTDVLDYSCVWADGSRDTDIAAKKVTDKINKLGPSLIEYDCPGGGGSHYTFGGAFNATQFLDRLAGGFGNGKYVNCTDCATIVSTFSNILGCELWQSCMREKSDYWESNSFKCNEILAIGGSDWDTPCGWSGFRYHEVAWKGECDINDDVFDACLEIDGDSDPTSAPHWPLLPVSIRFGTCSGPLEYRRRLATQATDGCPRCNPQPSTKKHRPVI